MALSENWSPLALIPGCYILLELRLRGRTMGEAYEMSLLDKDACSHGVQSQLVVLHVKCRASLPLPMTAIPMVILK
jgi:hypothetical protein